MTELLSSIKEVSRLFILGCILVLFIALTRENQSGLGEVKTWVESLATAMRHPLQLQANSKSNNASTFLKLPEIQHPIDSLIDVLKSRRKAFANRILAQGFSAKQGSMLLDMEGDGLQNNSNDKIVGIVDSSHTFYWLKANLNGYPIQNGNQKPLRFTSLLGYFRNSFYANYEIAYLDYDELERQLSAILIENADFHLGKYLSLMQDYTYMPVDTLRPAETRSETIMWVNFSENYGYTASIENLRQKKISVPLRKLIVPK